jgi:hypothetical protein
MVLSVFKSCDTLSLLKFVLISAGAALLWAAKPAVHTEASLQGMYTV